MRETKAPLGNCPDADPSMMTRQEALTDALKARRTPQPDRDYSTLVRSPCARCDGRGWFYAPEPDSKDMVDCPDCNAPRVD